jgi:imidazoleglycerol phosphate synthase glutamine amidotransferase subunit HisH
MYELIRSLGWNRLAVEQAPPFLVAFVAAELFYKFHSFTLECAAFLLTWFVLDAAWRRIGPRGRPARQA